MSKLSILLDFGYVILQRRLSSARYLMKTGLTIAAISIGVGSYVGSISYQGFVLTADSNSSPIIPIIINIFICFGLISLFFGFFLELYEHFWGEAAKANRAKSIDLRSLTQANAPKLSLVFRSLIESSGVHDDLYLSPKENECLSDWLLRSVTAFNSFAKSHLLKLNQYENEHPLALGAQAHIPHCFVLGFLIGNKRLVNYFCWNRDLHKNDKSRWIDCRDKRMRGQSTNNHINAIISRKIDNDTDVRKLGLSIEMSIPSNPKNFMMKAGLDAVYQIGLENQTIGNLFSEKDQVNIINEIRLLLNNNIFKKYENLAELHITITAQASFIMRLGADFNQNHFPHTIKIYHFENQRYPWCFHVSPNIDSIEYSIHSDLIGEVA